MKGIKRYLEVAMKERENNVFEAQARTIMNLQEQIRLLNFDLAESNKVVGTYKLRLNQARKTIIKTREELEKMIKNDDYSGLRKVALSLRDVSGKSE